jgi:hypothetical protein
MNKSLIALIGRRVLFTKAYSGDQGEVGEFLEITRGVYVVKSLPSHTFITEQVAEIRVRAGEMPQIYVEPKSDAS